MLSKRRCDVRSRRCLPGAPRSLNASERVVPGVNAAQGELRDWSRSQRSRASRSGDNPRVDPSQPPSGGNDDKNERSLSQPQADPSSRYHATLRQSARSYPLTTEALMRADRHRPRRWQQFIDPVDLQAIELLLNFLTSASRSLGRISDTRDLTFLPARIADDVRISLEGLLSGYLQVVSDAMRDVMETELLIRDFALDPNQIEMWRDASEEVLRKNFQPRHLRQRQAKALQVAPTNVPGAADYRAHSELLHVRPPLLFPRTPESGALAGHRVIRVLEAIAEIMFHGTSAVQALSLLLGATSHPVLDSDRALAALTIASEDLSQAGAAVEAIERLVAESLSNDEHRAVMLFESGLVVAVSPDTGGVEFYRTDRVDFRTFHRDVASNHAASFELTSLGESDIVAEEGYDNRST